MAAVKQDSKEGRDGRKNYHLDTLRKRRGKVCTPQVNNRIPHHTDAGACQMKRYNLHLQGMAYAMTAYGLNPRDALNRFKQENKLSRMPKGYAIWSA
jgi:hypothetical protein